MSFYDLPFFPVGGGVGENGKDGVSPTIAVANITGGHRLTIVDAVGTKTVDIMDGTAGGSGKDGAQGPAGKNGTNAIIKSASATVDNSAGTPGVTVTTDGSESERIFTFAFTGLKGEPGKDGSAGNDGRGINTISINGAGELIVKYTDNAEINLGKIIGEPGPKGDTGDAGADGKTPAKGTDYFTEADKSEIINAVIASLPKYSGGIS